MTLLPKKKPLKKPTRSRLDYLETELVGVEELLYQLRHNRGRWPRKWCRGMIRHYEDKAASLKDGIARAVKARRRPGRDKRT